MAINEDMQNLIEKLPELDVNRPNEKEKGHAAPKGKLTGPAWPDAEKMYEQVIKGGKPAVLAVIDQIKTPDTGPAYGARYLLHGIAVYVCRKGKEAQRKVVTDALVSAITSDKPRILRADCVRILQTCGTAAEIPALAPLLSDDELCDPAAQAMVTLGAGSAESLRKALASAKSRARLAVVQALGVLKDAAAFDALAAAAGDANEDVRLTALWGLSRLANPKAVDIVIKATDATDTWPRNQAVKHALVLAENLVAAGRKPEAISIYKHLQETRASKEEAFVRQAAERGLAEVQ